MERGRIIAVAGGIFIYVLTCSSISWSYLAKASWYGPGFHNKTAANGKLYNMYSFTAAHKTLLFGTKVKITNPKNGQSVIVEITDRGPYIPKREFDLSLIAARKIGLTKNGVELTEIEILKNKSEFYSYRIKKGETLWRLFGANWPIIARLNRISPKRIRRGMKIIIPYDWQSAKTYSPLPVHYHYQTTNRNRKFILINLEKQALGFYQSGKLSFWLPISSGKKLKKTPKGNFRILQKDKDHFSSKYPLSNGGGASMKYGLNFFKDYWIHAGVLSGQANSHGCVRLLEKDAKKLFLWAEIKTPIEIK